MKRIARQVLTFAWIVMLFLALGSCAGNPSVSTGVGVHSHGGRW